MKQRYLQALRLGLALSQLAAPIALGRKPTERAFPSKVTVTGSTQKGKNGETYGVVIANPKDLKSKDRAIYTEAARIIKQKHIFTFAKAKQVLDDVILNMCGEGCAWDLKRVNGHLLSGSTKTHTGLWEYGGVFYVLKVDDKVKRLYYYGTLDEVAAPPPKSKKRGRAQADALVRN